MTFLMPVIGEHVTILWRGAFYESRVTAVRSDGIIEMLALASTLPEMARHQRSSNEGITWCRGWDDASKTALRAAYNLAL